MAPLTWHAPTMKTYTAIEVRKSFGRILDEAAAGERCIIERAGVPVAAIVPLADVEAHDPERIRQRRLEALDRIVRRAHRIQRRYGPFTVDGEAIIRAERDGRAAHITLVLDEHRAERPER